MVRFSEECIWPDSTVILRSSTEHKRRYQLSLCQAPQLQSFTRRLHTALCSEHSEQYQTAVTLGLRMPALTEDVGSFSAKIPVLGDQQQRKVAWFQNLRAESQQTV